MPRMTIHELLEEARARLTRLSPAELAAAIGEGAVVIDTRSEDLRRRDGVIPGSLHYPLSELEWWLDPSSEFASPAIRLDTWIVLVCAEGYASTLAAARLQALGFSRATDLVGGFDAWQSAGMPVRPVPS
jgi:rhodanese-related sulfurtransferase